MLLCKKTGFGTLFCLLLFKFFIRVSSAFDPWLFLNLSVF